MRASKSGRRWGIKPRAKQTKEGGHKSRHRMEIIKDYEWAAYKRFLAEKDKS